MGQIDSQTGNGRTAGGGQPNLSRANPYEMPVPFLSARVKQTHDPSCDVVNAAQIARFEEITQMARPAKIGRAIRTEMFAGEGQLNHREHGGKREKYEESKISDPLLLGLLPVGPLFPRGSMAI